MARGEREQAGWRCDGGTAMLEYVLIAIVVGLSALFFVYRFSGSVAHRWESASLQVDKAKGVGDGAGVAQVEGRVAPAIEGVDVAGEPTPTEASPPSDGRAHVGNFSFDFSTVLGLGLAVLVIAAIITVRMFSAAKAKPKT